MPSIFARKKSSTPSTAQQDRPPLDRLPSHPSRDPADRDTHTHTQAQRPARQAVDPSEAHKSHSQSRSAQSSPEKKSRSSFVREQTDKDKKPKSPRSSRTFASRRKSSDSHPLNLPPEELRRLSALQSSSANNMASPKEEKAEPMQESTPAPQTPGSFPQANGNGVNGEHSEEGSAPQPPPHRSPSNSPPQSPAVDAEKCKEAGNKFFKSQQYDKAIEEYTKGGYSLSLRNSDLRTTTLS